MSTDMPVHKYTRRTGKTAWFYKFNLPGSTRTRRQIIRGWGYATKLAAVDAERLRYAEELRKIDLANAGVVVADAVPATLRGLLQEFFRQHVDQKLALKTGLRYHEQAGYLDPELLAMPI